MAESVEMERTSRLDADAGLAPVSSLGVVSEKKFMSVFGSMPKPHILIHSPSAPQHRRHSSGKSDNDSGGAFVPDGVVCPQSNPLWDWAVLLLRFGELLLGAEGLVGLSKYC